MSLPRMITTIDRPLSPAQKAWVTRRAQGWVPKASGGDAELRPPVRADKAKAAIAAFEVAGDAAMPDWHAVALQLKQALETKPAPRITTVPADRLPAPRLDDYAVTSPRRLVWCPPTIVCTFADGETVRMSFASIVDRPLNIGRGLRVAITAYRFRVAVRRFGRSNLAWKQRLVAVPEIVACAVERDDVEVARYDLDLVNRETSKWRQAMPVLTDQRGPP